MADLQLNQNPPSDEISEVKVQEKKDIKMPLIIGGSIVVVAIAATGLALVTTDDADDKDIQDVPGETKNEILEAVSYKDGTYYSKATFYVEAAETEHTIGVTIVVEDGNVKSVTTSMIEESEVVEDKYMDEFSTKISDSIVGKPIEEAYLTSFVSGSTLTSDAFKDALEMIVEDAETTEAGVADGEYYAEIEYYVAAKEESDTLGVTVTLEDGAIEDVLVVQIENGEVKDSEYMVEFTNKLKELIIGKTLEEANPLSMVSGSTLTSNAFQDALKSIDTSN